MVLLGLVLRTSDYAELAGTVTARHGLVHICRVMSRQVVPNKNVMVVCPLGPKLLNLRANVIAEITENAGCCPTAMHTPNPTPRILHTSEDMMGGPRIPRLDREYNCDLGTKMVVPIFTHPENPQCPSLRAVALLRCNTKLIDVNELVSGHLKNSERGGAVKEAPDTELSILPLSLIGFSGSPLLCDLQLSEVLRESLLRVQWPSLVVEEESHVVEGGFRPGPQEGHKIDHFIVVFIVIVVVIIIVIVIIIVVVVAVVMAVVMVIVVVMVVVVVIVVVMVLCCLHCLRLHCHCCCCRGRCRRCRHHRHCCHQSRTT